MSSLYNKPGISRQRTDGQWGQEFPRRNLRDEYADDK